jgi:predicted enzyme related to lactoylglutathione lyase
MNNAINWFEIPANDFDRAVKFYSNILDVEMQVSDANGMSYAMFPVQEGVGGGIVKHEGFTPSDKGPLVYLNGGDDLNNVLSKVETAGGKVEMEKTKINDEYGFFAIFHDSEGNRMALHSRG